MDIKVYDKYRQPTKSHACENNGGCSHLCLLAPVPPWFQCACPIGIKLIGESQYLHAQDVHMHLNRPLRMRCSEQYYNETIFIASDSKNCAPGPQELLLLAKRTEICQIYLDSPEYSSKVMPLKDVKYAIAVDYDPVDGYIYWSDDEVKKIQKSKLDGFFFLFFIVFTRCNDAIYR